MPLFASSLELAAHSVLLQPRRFLAALTATVAVVASAEAVQAIAPGDNAASLSMIYGGLVAFNLLLFFPPGTLTQPPLRLVGALAVNLVPLPLAPFLYGISPSLADAALIVAAGVSVLVRPFGAPFNGLALLLALNLLIPLVMGGAAALTPLGAVASVSGTVFAAVADAIVVLLLRTRAPDLERRLLRSELAGFLTDLSRLWRSGEIWPAPRLDARIALVRTLREELAPAIQGGVVALPADAMLEGVVRCAVGLRAEKARLSVAAETAIGRSLEALAEAARMDRPDAAARAIQGLREVALRPPVPGEPDPPARVLGLTLLLSDLAAAALPGSDAVKPPVLR